MKKHVIAIFPAIVVIAAGLLILLGLRSRDSFEPSYRFLGGRNPINCEKGKTGITDKRYSYSFEADFNDISSKADAELIPDGFAAKAAVQILSGNESRERYYYLKERFPRGPVWIYIYNNRRYEKLPNSKHYAMSEKDGWIMVEIAYGRGWRWPF